MSKKLILGMLVIITLSVNIVQAGTISIVDLPATGTDGAIDISVDKIYTHTFDFGSNAPVTINGVAFEQGPTANLTSVYTGTSSWGYGYTIDDTRRPMNVWVFAGNDEVQGQADGNSNGLLRDMIFQFNGPIGESVILTLSDLTPGTTYSTRWYYRRWEDDGMDRTITFKADGESNGTFSDTFETDTDVGGAHYLDYTFTADDTDVTLQFINSSSHDNRAACPYGLSNEVIRLPNNAFCPNPVDGTEDVPRDVVLSWEPGEFAAPVNGHKVYLGESFDDVNDAFGGVAQTAASYAPTPRLDFGTTYYWRVDEVNAPPFSHIEFKGEVWSFTTEPIGYPIEDVNATASSSNSAEEGPENTINGSGLNANDLHSDDSKAMWLSSMTGSQPTWIQYEFDRVYKLHQLWVWNHNTTLEAAVGFGVKDATIEYSLDGANWTTLGTTHEFARAPGSAGYAYNTFVDLGGAAAKYVKITANSNWEGLLPQYGLSEVRFFYVPLLAREPQPELGATDVDVNLVLKWRAGREAASHDVYLSDSNQAVIDETISPVSVPAGSSYASYGPLYLDLAQTYYWKVNEVNEAETTTTWQGDIWNLTTLEYLVVDDFEAYNDLNPDDLDSNRIFNIWIDGYDIPTNGSVVGYDVPPFCEKSIVHSGAQSMPFSYNNGTVAYSEARVNIADLPIGQGFDGELSRTDSTKYGIKALTLMFSGDPNNAVQQMYVKLNGSKVTYDGDAENIKRTGWQMWYIDLASLGMSLSNVTELSIGFERSGAVGGQGKVLFDDIRLYSYDRQLITPAEPNTAGLVGHWMFDEGSGTVAVDSSAKGNDGTLNGGPQWVAGQIGGALNFNSTDDYVDISSSSSLESMTDITISAWIKAETLQPAQECTIVRRDAYQLPGVRTIYLMDLFTDGHLRLFFWGKDSADMTIGTSTTDLRDGNWHHVAVVRDNGNTKAYGYVDGIAAIDVTDIADGSFESADTSVYIGQYDRDNSNSQFKGTIDEVRIYDRALSQAEIAWLSGMTKPFDKPF